MTVQIAIDARNVSEQDAARIIDGSTLTILVNREQVEKIAPFCCCDAIRFDCFDQVRGLCLMWAYWTGNDEQVILHVPLHNLSDYAIRLQPAGVAH
jgi:hypothetical protein